MSYPLKHPLRLIRIKKKCFYEIFVTTLDILGLVLVYQWLLGIIFYIFGHFKSYLWDILDILASQRSTLNGEFCTIISFKIVPIDGWKDRKLSWEGPRRMDHQKMYCVNNSVKWQFHNKLDVL